MKKGIQFGAGNIGRGFIGHLLWESGFEIIFVEAREDLVQLLNERKSYPLRLLRKDGKEEDLIIDNLRAFSTQEQDKVAKEIKEGDVVFTAVGVKNLPFIAPLLAQGLELRSREGDFLNIFLCENLKDAPQLLRREIEKYLSPTGKKFLEERVGLVGTVVARMVPVMGERYGVEDPLFVVAESYHHLPFDAQAVKGKVPEITGLKAASNFPAEVDRKLFIHNLGHATLAYLGYHKGYTYIHEAIKDEEIRKVLDGAWEEVSRALLRKYPDLDPREHQELVTDLRERFANHLLLDTLERVGREPLRKLAPEDRLVGGANLCLSQGIFPHYIAIACGAALAYDCYRDEEAMKLQKMIQEEGVEKVVEEICGVKTESELGQAIVSAYKNFSRERKEWK
ncbi:MAG: mannitol-phosphate 5-dehydrogenase [Candidatus Atribacteria bacterium]|nr:mannitol-phosphate 5-dehydrogenase [Candidatus Atribacteria bacterium]